MSHRKQFHALFTECFWWTNNKQETVPSFTWSDSVHQF